MNLGHEDSLSQDVKIWLNRLNEIGAIDTVHFHVPNEFVAKGNAFAAWNKKEAIGCLSGAPDWVIVASDVTLLIELKAAKTLKSAIGKMRKAQSDFAKECDKKQIYYKIVYDKESFQAALTDSGILKNQPLAQA